LSTHARRQFAPARLMVATAVAAGSLVLAPSPAQAAYIEAPTLPPGPHSLAVEDTAEVNSKGTKVTWRVKITCPKGERYSVTGVVTDRGREQPLPGPYRALTYDGVSAFKATSRRYPAPAATGKCTGKTQRLRLTLPVRDTTLYAADGTAHGRLFLPMGVTKAPLVDAEAYLVTPTTPDRGKPYYCQAVDSECEDATQIGPGISLT
jgi:hypothetical protein